MSLTRRTFVAAGAAWASAPAFAQPERPGPAALLAGSGVGPTLRVRRGDKLNVRLTNDSDRPTAIHWHGCRIANALDGVPGLTQRPIAPGARFDYRFTPVDAGTFWYHPAATMGGPAFAGPVGALIVTEMTPIDVDQDILFLLTSDGLPVPQIIRAAQHERWRLRFVNATTDPIVIRLERHRLVVIALDGQPAEPLSTRDGRLGLGPGNRADVLVDITLAPDERAELTLEGGAGRRLAEVVGVGPNRAPRGDPGALPDNPLPKRIDLANALRVSLNVAAPADRTKSAPLFSTRRGRTVVLTLTNTGQSGQAAHLHGHAFRLLDQLDDGWKPFWLDTLFCPPSDTARVALVADNPGRWLIEAGGNGIAWFEVT